MIGIKYSKSFEKHINLMSHHFLSELQAAHEQGSFAAFIKASAASGELFKAIPALTGLDKVEQDPFWHPEGNVWIHTLLVVENLPPNATFAMSLAALFHDTGKAYTSVSLPNGRISARGHEQVSKKIASEVLDDLGADANLKEDVLFLVYHHMLAHGKDTKEKTLQKLIYEGSVELVDQLLLHGVADVKSGCGDFTECNRLRELFERMSKQGAPFSLQKM